MTHTSRSIIRLALAASLMLTALWATDAQAQLTKTTIKPHSWTEIYVCRRPLYTNQTSYCTTVGKLSRYAPAKAKGIADVVKTMAVKALFKMKVPPISLTAIKSFELFGFKLQATADKLKASGEFWNRLLGSPALAGCGGKGTNQAGIYLSDDPMGQADGPGPIDLQVGADCPPGLLGQVNDLTSVMGGLHVDLTSLGHYTDELLKLMNQHSTATTTNQAGPALPADGGDPKPGDPKPEETKPEETKPETPTPETTDEELPEPPADAKPGSVVVKKGTKTTSVKTIVGTIYNAAVTALKLDDDSDGYHPNIQNYAGNGKRGECMEGLTCGTEKEAAQALAAYIKDYEGKNTCTNPYATANPTGPVNACYSILSNATIDDATLAQFRQDACDLGNTVMDPGGFGGTTYKDSCAQLEANLMIVSQMELSACSLPESLCAPELPQGDNGGSLPPGTDPAPPSPLATR